MGSVGWNRIGMGNRGNSVRRAGVLVILAAVFGVPRAVDAATLAGSLPSSATAARLLSLDCSDDGAGAPLSATVQIRDLGPASAPIVSVQLRRGTAATNSSDDVDGGAGASPLVFVNGGAGRYDLFVNKTASGEESFEVSAQCWTGAAGSGVPTGTALFAAQGGAVPAASVAWQGVLVAGLMLTGVFRIGASSLSTARRRAAGDLRAH
jgi:hypothetical protein